MARVYHPDGPSEKTNHMNNHHLRALQEQCVVQSLTRTCINSAVRYGCCSTKHLLCDVHPVLAKFVVHRGLLTTEGRAVTGAVNEQRERRDVLKANHYKHKQSVNMSRIIFGNKVDQSSRPIKHRDQLIAYPSL